MPDIVEISGSYVQIITHKDPIVRYPHPLTASAWYIDRFYLPTDIYQYEQTYFRSKNIWQLTII